MTTDHPTQIGRDGGRTTCGMCFGYGYLENKAFRVLGGEIECLQCGGTGITGNDDDVKCAWDVKPMYSPVPTRLSPP